MSDPYKRFDKLKTATVVSGLTLTFGAARYFQDQIPKSIDQFAAMVFLLAYALVPLMLWLFISYIVVPIVLEKRFFRTFVLGRRYVEGTWIEWLRDPMGQEAMSIINIQPDKETFAMSGTNHDEEGNINHSFKVTLWKFNWPYLDYCYESTTGGSSGEYQGVGLFQFLSQESGFRGAPTSFTGSFTPGGASGNSQVIGKRLSDEESAQLVSEEKKRMIIGRYFSEFRAKSSLQIIIAG
jgi:hypothetical protein